MSLLLGAQTPNGAIVSNGENFHCWVDADTHVIDFQAPLFSKIYKLFNKDQILPPQNVSEEIF